MGRTAAITLFTLFISLAGLAHGAQQSSTQQNTLPPKDFQDILSLPSYQKYVADKQSQKKADLEITEVQKQIESANRELQALKKSYNEQSLPKYLAMTGIFGNTFLSTSGSAVYLLLFLSLGLGIGYFTYLCKWNKPKLRLMTHRKTISRFFEKISFNNKMIGVAIIAALALPTNAFAKTNILDDIKMYYSGSTEAKGYVDIKYHGNKATLSYDSVKGIPLIKKMDTPFAVSYNMLAHTVGLAFKLDTSEFIAVYQLAAKPEDRALVVKLLSKMSQEYATQCIEKLVDYTTSQRELQWHESINIMRDFCATLTDDGATEARQNLATSFAIKKMEKVQSIFDAYNIGMFAIDNRIFDSIKDKMQQYVSKTPQKGPFLETLCAARLWLPINPETAMAYFKSIRYNFQDIAKRVDDRFQFLAPFQGLVGGLMDANLQEPLFESDALTKTLAQQNTVTAMIITKMMDNLNSPFAQASFSGISLGYDSLKTLNPLGLEVLSGLVKKYAPGQAQDVQKSVIKLTGEGASGFTKENTFKIAQALGASGPQMALEIVEHDRELGKNSRTNNDLLLSMISELPSGKMDSFVEYFKTREHLYKPVLSILYGRNDAAFSALLYHAYFLDPASFKEVRYPNDILNLELLEPLFPPEAIAKFKSLPAAFYVALNALKKQEPDVKTAKRALVPIFGAFFNGLMNADTKALTTAQALNAILLLEMVKKTASQEFADEIQVLTYVINDYFQGVIQNDIQASQTRLDEAKNKLAEINKAITRVKEEMNAFLPFKIYSTYLMLFIALATILSIIYATNRITPGFNFNLLYWLLYAAESYWIMMLTTIIFIPFCLTSIIMIQFIKGLLLKQGAELSHSASLEYVDLGMDGNNTSKTS